MREQTFALMCKMKTCLYEMHAHNNTQFSIAFILVEGFPEWKSVCLSVPCEMDCVHVSHDGLQTDDLCFINKSRTCYFI